MNVVLSRREWGMSAAALLAASVVPPEVVGEPVAAGSAQPDGPLYFDLHIDTPGRMVGEGLGLGERARMSERRELHGNVAGGVFLFWRRPGAERTAVGLVGLSGGPGRVARSAARPR